MVSNKGFYIILYGLTLALGFITPFWEYFVAFQVFIFLFPLAVLLFVSIISLIICLLVYKKTLFRHYFTHFTLIIPIFLCTQILSIFLVHTIQKARADFLINDLDKTQNLPSSHEFLGLKYQKIDEKRFKIEYYRGFFVREVYYSDDGVWRSYGWND